jgi:hypothetical protein
MNTPISRTARRWMIVTLAVGIAVLGGLSWMLLAQGRGLRTPVGLPELTRATPGVAELTPAINRPNPASIFPSRTHGLPAPRGAPSPPAPQSEQSGAEQGIIKGAQRREDRQHRMEMAHGPERSPVSAEQARRLLEILRANNARTEHDRVSSALAQ